MRIWFVIFAILGATGCATPTTMGPQVNSADVLAEQQRQLMYSAQQRAAYQARVDAITYRLFTANAELCSDRRARLGISIHALDTYKRNQRAIAARRLGTDARPEVLTVAPGSSAAAAGLVPGDRIVAVNNAPIPRKKAGRSALRMLDDAPQTFALTIDRKGEIMTADVTKTLFCDYNVFIDNSDQVGAFADGNNITVHAGMMRFVESDDELAYVLSHELAHNSERHLDSRKKNAILGAIGGALIDGVFAAGGVNTGGEYSNLGAKAGAQAFSQEFETEADYVGLYYMVRAGFNPNGVENIWRRMGANEPLSIVMASTHPTTAARYVRIAATRDEIYAKHNKGYVLLPGRKEGEDRLRYACATDCSPPTPMGMASTRRPATANKPTVSNPTMAMASNMENTGVPAQAAGFAPSNGNLSQSFASAMDRPGLGIEGVAVTRESTIAVFMADPHGVRLSKLEPNGPAARAGLLRGDVIQRIDGVRVESLGDIESLLQTATFGTTVQILLWRDRQLYDASVKL